MSDAVLFFASRRRHPSFALVSWARNVYKRQQDAIMEASEITRHQNLAKVPSARNYAMAELRKCGVEFNSLSDDQSGEWQAAGGYQLEEWDSFCSL